MEFDKISPMSPNDTITTTNPTKFNKVYPTTTPKRSNVSLEKRRENWWTGLRTMWSKAGTTLRMPRRNFILLTCMRRRRERLENTSTSLSTSSNVIDEPFKIINTSPFVHVEIPPVRVGINHGTSFRKRKLTPKEKKKKCQNELTNIKSHGEAKWKQFLNEIFNWGLENKQGRNLISCKMSS